MMKCFALALVALLIGTIAFQALAGDSPTTAPQVPSRPGWTLTWHDEFDGPTLDPKQWDIVKRKDSYNNELQYYLPEQVKILDGGILRLTAVNEPLEGKQYRSGLVMSWFTQTYGRFECRAKLPMTQGMWPAFWLLPRPADWPRRGEIDVMESRGKDTTWFSTAYHFADPKTAEHRTAGHGHRPKNSAGRPINLAEDFHVYAVEWEPGELRFYLDDDPQPVYRVTKDQAPVSDQPMGIILNLAVGGWFGGEPDKTTVFPQHFDIDYVRVWKRADGGATRPTSDQAAAPAATPPVPRQ